MMMIIMIIITIIIIITMSNNKQTKLKVYRFSDAYQGNLAFSGFEG